VYGRGLGKLRISVTDRCNLRCRYCMPREHYTWMPSASLLDFEEIARCTRVLASLGVERLRLTGGEPLLRRELHVLVEQLAAIEGIRSVALTTNGILLAEQAHALHAAGLQGVTVSLDTLQADRFVRIASRDGLLRVLAGFDAAIHAGFTRMKLNTVVMRGYNEDEINDLIAFARERAIEPRFIEYMDVGGAVDWSPALVVPRPEILARVQAVHGPLRQLHNRDGSPSDRFQLPDGFVMGVISSTTQPFCSRCDRARMTADGTLFTCLYAQHGLDLRALLRGNPDDAALRQSVERRWSQRTDRGAEQRLALADRGPLVSAEALLANPRLEMHKRGG
jgi:cyclic pyranopterin phosphate synthase